MTRVHPLTLASIHAGALLAMTGAGLVLLGGDVETQWLGLGAVTSAVVLALGHVAFIVADRIEGVRSP